MKLISNQESCYESSSDASTADANATDASADADTDTHQWSIAMAVPEEDDNVDVLQQNIVADHDDDDLIIVMSGLLLTSMNNIVREMEGRRGGSASSRCLPRHRHLDSRHGPSSSQLPEALVSTGTRTNTTLRRRIVSDDVSEDDTDSDSDSGSDVIAAAPCSGRMLSSLIDIVDEALQVVGGHHGSNDGPYDFDCMAEETFVITMDPDSSTKSTIKKYSCNKEGDFFVKLDRNHSR